MPIMTLCWVEKTTGPSTARMTTSSLMSFVYTYNYRLIIFHLYGLILLYMNMITFVITCLKSTKSKSSAVTSNSPTNFPRALSIHQASRYLIRCLNRWVL
ncbi:hypothetical protein BJX63DRAFT_9783 [Aspergillus granulosus]|uniref:Uncharacterized protein n=1 Tax=Aspergillus granulosus TaxID=176169 RepID=A0ABR4HVM1_9EURO